jgi:hypothetical protein
MCAELAGEREGSDDDKSEVVLVAGLLKLSSVVFDNE